MFGNDILVAPWVNLCEAKTGKRASPRVRTSFRSLSLSKCTNLSKCNNHRSGKAAETENAVYNRGVQITYNERVRLLPGTKFQTRRSCLWLIVNVLSATGTANSKCPADAMIRGNKYIVPLCFSSQCPVRKIAHNRLLMLGIRFHNPRSKSFDSIIDRGKIHIKNHTDSRI